jgi:hypothetical protein
MSSQNSKTVLYQGSADLGANFSTGTNDYNGSHLRFPPLQFIEGAIPIPDSVSLPN